MSLEWRSWCRLCASSGGNGFHVFENKELLLPEKILKYLSISIDSQDDLPQTICQTCSQRLGSFDCYAEQCLRVQAMFRAMMQASGESGEEVDTKVGLIREEFLQENEAKTQENEEPEDSKKGIEILDIEEGPEPVSDSNSTVLKRTRTNKVRKRVVRTNKAPKTRVRKLPCRASPRILPSRVRSETDGERRSTRLQGIVQMQREFELATAGALDSEEELKIKEEKQDEDEPTGPKENDPPAYQPPAAGTVTVKKRGRPSKALVGAAKRKAKTPRIVKLKPIESTETLAEPAAEIETDSATPIVDKKSPSEENCDTDVKENSENNVDAHKDAAGEDSSDNNKEFDDDHENNDEEDEDEEEDDDGGGAGSESGDIKKEDGEDKGGTGEGNHQPAIFRWECHVCGEVCRNWNSLSVHCRRMHEEPAHVVCLCAKVLASRASIIKHRLKHTNTYKYRCTKCDKAFHRRALYDIHVLSHVPKEEQPFVCCKCARRFHCEALLRQHERVHLPREERLIYPCEICSKKFSSKSAVSAHLKAVHFGERPFVCDQCGHSFTSKGILQEHLTIHSDETPFKCTQCKKSFKTKYRLKIHSDTHRETPYECPVCPLKLSTRRTLRMHLVVHRDTKAYQCATCGKAFRRAKDLKNHHNLHTGRRPYTCTFCPRTFANGSNCRSHKRRMHPEELRIYEASLAAAENNDSQSITDNGAQNANPGSEHHQSQVDTSPSLHIATSLQMANSLHNVLSNVSKATTSVSTPSSDYQRHASSTESNMYGSPVGLKSLSNVSRSTANPMASTAGGLDYTSASESDMARVVMGHLAVSGSGAASMLRNTSMLPSLVPLTAASMLRDSDSNGMRVSRGLHSDDGCNRSQSVVTMNTNGSRRPDMNVSTPDSVMSPNNHVQSLTPLNLNISEIHAASRQQQQQPHSLAGSPSLSSMDESELMSRGRRVMDSFSVGQRPHHLNSAGVVHQVHRQTSSASHHHGLAVLSREDRDMLDLDGRSSAVQMHHHSQQQQQQGGSAMLHDFSTSLNHLYQHHQGPSMSSAVAAAIAHSGTVGVPAFPGNPYVHHNMGYNRGSGNM